MAAARKLGQLCLRLSGGFGQASRPVASCAVEAAVLAVDGTISSSTCVTRGLSTSARFGSLPALRSLIPAAMQPHCGCRGFASLPPHTVLDMPALSPTMSQGNIAAWKKKEGEEIAAGDVLCEVETDKATMEWEAQDEGVLAKILVQEGAQDIPVGTPVAVVCDDAKDVDAFKDFSPGSSGAEASSSEPSKEESQPAEAEASGGEKESGGKTEEASGSSGGDFPPHTVAGLPALSPTMSQGNIAKWNKKEGDEIQAGDSIAEIETDKATMDWEAQDDGFVAKLLVPEGAKDISVGSPVIVITEDQDTLSAFKDFTLEDASGAKPKKSQPKQEPKEQSKQAEPTQAEPKKEAPKAAPAAPKPSSGQRVIASPYAKKLAREAGVDISQATATRPDGRIVAADVQKLIDSGDGKTSAPTAAKEEGAPSAASGGQAPDEYMEFKDAPLSQIKRITAQRLLQSKQTIPHYYLTIDCHVDKLLALRAQLNEALVAGQGGKLSVNDFVVKASALALKKVPGVNASWRGESIREFMDINISIAVQTDNGLMVPVVRHADTKGLGEINKNVKEVAFKAREGKLKPAEYDGGTFTISNLGMYGVDQFSAIINPPQAAILAVGGTTKRVVAVSGGFSEAAIMSVTLSCDHRVVDGAMGAQWLQAFRANIEDPITMLL